MYPEGLLEREESMKKDPEGGKDQGGSGQQALRLRRGQAEWTEKAPRGVRM